MKLEDIANISIGVLTSREVNKLGRYEYKIFNLKNYDSKEDYEIVRTSSDFGKKLTQKEDILIRLIYPNRVIYINEEMEGLLVPSQMCLVRPNKEKINAEFLKWYLESDMCRQKILLDVTGTTIPKITVSSLRKIDVPKISLENQNLITNLIKLWDKEKNILEEIISQKNFLYNNIIEQIIEKEGEN